MGREEDFLKKRIRDLANQSYQTGQYTYTSFLRQAEQELFFQMEREPEMEKGMLFGGAEGCERQVLRFGDEESLGYDAGFPICCIEIAPALPRFSDSLSHRDYLGALMNLGIERNTLGDIVQRENTAYLFCLDKVADYIVENLDRIKHTSVKCRRQEQLPDAVKPQRETVKLVVPSLRLDVVLAKLYHLSRSQSIRLFQERKVFVNGRLTEGNSTALREGDVVSVRGYGKFQCGVVAGETRKGKQNLQISRYV